MARGRIVKYPPKRGKLNRNVMRRVVREVVLGKGYDGSRKASGRSTAVTVRRDAKTGRFVSREAAESQADNVVVETIRKPARAK